MLLDIVETPVQHALLKSVHAWKYPSQHCWVSSRMVQTGLISAAAAHAAGQVLVDCVQLAWIGMKGLQWPAAVAAVGRSAAAVLVNCAELWLLPLKLQWPLRYVKQQHHEFQVSEGAKQVARLCYHFAITCTAPCCMVASSWATSAKTHPKD